MVKIVYLRVLTKASAVALLVCGLFSASSLMAQSSLPPVGSYTQPQLLPQKGYTETWDQHIFFEDGTFVTARFLIANFAASNPRAFVISTMVTPDGKKYTIKNGRDRDGWSFDPKKFDLRIAGHRLNGEPPNFQMHLHNNTAEALLKVQAVAPSWQVGRLCCGTSPQAYQDMIAYVPVAEAEGWYRPGTDSGGKGDEEPWRPLKGGRGFATHYVNSLSVEKVARNWLHFFAFDSEGQRVLPGLVAMSLPHAGKMARFALLNAQKPEFETDLVTVDVIKSQTQGKTRDVPAAVRITAKGQNRQVTGTITFDRLLETIVLKDKLTWVERMFASSLPSTAQFYYLVRYDFKVETAGVTQTLTGKGLVEYTAIGKP